jgi:hypothetical protein
MESQIGRFQVMALLQAARYYVLTGDLEKSYSFGLNRAIFYAWAKRRGVPVAASRQRQARDVSMEKDEEGKTIVYVGDEAAYLGKNGWFTMGDQDQTPELFEREVKNRIERIMPFEDAWRLAVEYVKSFDKKTLLSQKDFYEKVYLPVRDTFPNLPKKSNKQLSLLSFGSETRDQSPP